jgi:hypothetical protein
MHTVLSSMIKKELIMINLDHKKISLNLIDIAINMEVMENNMIKSLKYLDSFLDKM